MDFIFGGGVGDSCDCLGVVLCCGSVCLFGCAYGFLLQSCFHVLFVCYWTWTLRCILGMTEILLVCDYVFV